MPTFVEEERFTKAAERLLTKGELFHLMQRLVESPGAGDVIPGSGGYRKLRLAAKGKGSRGGARVIYLYLPQAGQIRLIQIYAKNEKGDLSAREVKILKKKIQQ